MAQNESKIKTLIQKLQDENNEFKATTTWMKSKDEEL
jgi:hypothetical protein